MKTSAPQRVRPSRRSITRPRSARHVPQLHLPEFAKAQFFLTEQIGPRAQSADQSPAVHLIDAGAGTNPFFRIFCRSGVECRDEHFPLPAIAEPNGRRPVEGIAKFIPLLQMQLAHLLDWNPDLPFAVKCLDDGTEQVVRVAPAFEGATVYVPFHPRGQFVRIVQDLAGLRLVAGGQEFRGALSLENVSWGVDEELRRDDGMPGVVCRE